MGLITLILTKTSILINLKKKEKKKSEVLKYNLSIIINYSTDFKFTKLSWLVYAKKTPPSLVEPLIWAKLINLSTTNLITC
jgi:hypothetical protein